MTLSFILGYERDWLVQAYEEIRKEGVWYYYQIEVRSADHKVLGRREVDDIFPTHTHSIWNTIHIPSETFYICLKAFAILPKNNHQFTSGLYTVHRGCDFGSSPTLPEPKTTFIVAPSFEENKETAQHHLDSALDTGDPELIKAANDTLQYHIIES